MSGSLAVFFILIDAFWESHRDCNCSIEFLRGEITSKGSFFSSSALFSGLEMLSMFSTMRMVAMGEWILVI